MDFDKPKVYGDTSITDGLVYIEGFNCTFSTQTHPGRSFFDYVKRKFAKMKNV